MEQFVQRRAKEDGEMSSVETLGRWLSDCPRPLEDAPSAELSLPLDGEMDRELRYLSARFGLRGDDLAKELLRSALRDTFAVIPSDPIPLELLPDIHDAGLDPSEFRWFDLDGAASGSKTVGGSRAASRESREGGG